MGSLETDYEAFSERAALWDLSDRTQLEITGRDRAAFLQNMCTNDVTALRAGGGCETFFTNAQGKIVGHGFLFATPETIVLDTAPGQAERLIAHLDRYVIREEVEIRDRTNDWGQMLLAGPDVSSALGEELYEALPSERLAHGSIQGRGDLAAVRRVDLVEGAAVSIVARRDTTEALRLMLQERGASPCGHESFEAARIEAGAPLYGTDITEENLPQEVGRNEQAINFRKGCYIGQETVARIDALGHVNRTLRRLKFAGSEVPQPGHEIKSGEKTVARITSASYSPKFAAPLALAYVRRGFEALGAKLATPIGEAVVS